jgi:tRNA modification GTPase
MFSTDDTIVAIATPPGRGGLGVVRLSGPSSHCIARSLLDRTTPLLPRHATFGRINGIDEVVATYFAAPHSYTADDVVEISAHGSPVVLHAIVGASMSRGARLAAPGEFTLRAFLNGRLDLVQSEAVADLIDAVTPLQARIAFDQLEGTLTERIARLESAVFELLARLEASMDFPDEGYHFIEPEQIGSTLAPVLGELEALLADARRGRTIREGAHVVVAGRPNVGKSTLFNKLAGHDRAIVSHLPGTTRDLVTERVEVLGIPVTLVDTAGLRQTDDVVEHEGVHRARQAAGVASLVVVVLDQSAPLDDDDRELLALTHHRERLIVRNKVDLAAAWDQEWFDDSLPLCAVTGDGVDVLRTELARRLTERDELRDTPAISNARHIELLERARHHVRRAIDAGREGVRTPEEFLVADLQEARGAFEEITGKRTSDDLLNHIFERFCIGK